MTKMKANVEKTANGGQTPFGKEMRKHFLFAENNRNLNHGMIALYLCESRYAVTSPELNIERIRQKVVRQGAERY